ncbi:acyl-CoA dehydrogenase family protein [Frondihabitans cladoniiphilus]|uniref:Acyl-CoA dehydrogenase family protein n=1 Tax=Frondihabitans cladoniiphilus TaxID=715785 RepID=A0ABP8W680_9MICO
MAESTLADRDLASEERTPDTFSKPGTASFADRAREVAVVAARHADDVDRLSRFPQESLEALRATGLLAAAVPADLGGEDATMADLVEISRLLGEACSATGMVFAMHQIQVLMMTRHGADSATSRATLARVASHGSLLASATTELGIGGNTRTSGCSVEPLADDWVSLSKATPVISYGAQADVVLATARRTADSAASDQVVVICPSPQTSLTQTSDWNTLGFRGTCSAGFELRAEVPADHVMDVDFATISSQTMLPVSHVLWAAVWFGIATAAADRARAVVLAAARKTIGTLPPSATRLAELLTELSAFEALVDDATRTFEDHVEDPEVLTSVALTMRFNSLKITASESVIAITSKAMLIAGIAGYRLDSEVSVGRLLRDSYGTAVMVNNDRILGNNAQISLLQRKKAHR